MNPDQQPIASEQQYRELEPCELKSGDEFLCLDGTWRRVYYFKWNRGTRYRRPIASEPTYNQHTYCQACGNRIGLGFRTNADGNWFCSNRCVKNWAPAVEALIGLVMQPEPTEQPKPEPEARLGIFGHHPDPATDFCVEVEALQGWQFNLGAGVRNDNKSFTGHLARALRFARMSPEIIEADQCGPKALALLREVRDKAEPETRSGHLYAAMEPAVSHHIPVEYMQQIQSRLEAVGDERDKALAEIERLQNNLAATQVELDGADKVIANYKAVWSDPAALHVNLLRSPLCAEMRDKFLHLAGANDYDRLAAENARLRSLLHEAIGAFQQYEMNVDDDVPEPHRAMMRRLLAALEGSQP